MRLFRLLVAFYIGLLFNFVSTVFLGPTGLREYERLMEYRDTLESNISALQANNWRLNQEFKNLGTEAEKIRLLARDMGYFGPGEWIVRINGVDKKNNYYEVGRLLKKNFTPQRQLLFIRIMNILLPLLFYIASGLYWRASRRGH